MVEALLVRGWEGWRGGGGQQANLPRKENKLARTYKLQALHLSSTKKNFKHSSPDSWTVSCRCGGPCRAELPASQRRQRDGLGDDAVDPRALARVADVDAARPRRQRQGDEDDQPAEAVAGELPDREGHIKPIVRRRTAGVGASSGRRVEVK